MIFGKKCINCSEYKNCKDSFAAWIFFIIGLAATVSIRIMAVLMHFNTIYAKLAWYIGIIGFFIFFLYKFRVSSARSRVIAQQNLVEKINSKKTLSDEDYAVMNAILCGLSSRKEQINYMVIFGLSAITIFFAIYMDFIK
jgi:hypothetical protein